MYRLVVVMSLLLALGAAAVLAGCASHKPDLQPDVAQPGTPLPLKLPSPASLLRQLHQSGAHHASLMPKFTEDDVQQDGSLFSDKVPSQHVANNNTVLKFHPQFVAGSASLDGLAYAGYHFNLPGYDRNAQVRLNWTAPPASAENYFIGLANWKFDRWEWFPGNAQHRIDLASFDDYTSQFDDIVVIVAALGQAEVQLGSVRIGGLAPLAALSTSAAVGAVPFNPTLDASGSSDPEGLPLTYRFDFDGDGVFDTASGPDASAEHSYAANGDYIAAVQVTNSSNVSSTSYVWLHAISDWTRGLGAPGDAHFDDVVTDSYGYIYAVGSIDNPGTNLLVTMWTPAGNLIWAKQWDAGADDYGVQVALDSESNLVVAGQTSGVGSPLVLVQKYSIVGQLLWSKSYSAPGTASYLRRMLVLGTDIYLGSERILSKNSDIVLAKLDKDGAVQWSSYRDSGDDDYLDDMQPIGDGLTVSKIALLSEATIAGATNLWKVEYKMDGSLARAQQLGTSAEPKSDGKLLYSYDQASGTGRYYVAGEVEIGNDWRLFSMATDNAGVNQWGKNYAGLEIRPDFMDFRNSRLLIGGLGDRTTTPTTRLITQTLGGVDLGMLSFNDPGSRVTFLGEQHSNGGMLLAGEGYESTVHQDTVALPSGLSFYRDFQTFSGSGGDATFTASNQGPAVLADIGQDVTLDSDAGLSVGLLSWRSGL